MRAEHLPVFACSMGDNVIHYLGHVKMMAAAQPFISGAISKTVNMPEDVTVEDVEQLHIDAWKMGLKAVAIYRDNCKVAQPLSTTKKARRRGDARRHRRARSRSSTPGSPSSRARSPSTSWRRLPTTRTRLPRRRRSNTFAFRVADCEGYVTVGEYEDGRPGEVFMKVSKQGSTLSGVMDAFAIAVSLGLQHGVPLSTFVRKYTNMRFEPAGITDDAELRLASSLVDYIFRRLALDYLPLDERIELGDPLDGGADPADAPGPRGRRARRGRGPAASRSASARAATARQPGRPRRRGRSWRAGTRRSATPAATSCNGRARATPARAAGRRAAARSVQPRRVTRRNRGM